MFQPVLFAAFVFISFQWSSLRHYAGNPQLYHWASHYARRPVERNSSSMEQLMTRHSASGVGTLLLAGLSLIVPTGRFAVREVDCP